MYEATQVGGDGDEETKASRQSLRTELRVGLFMATCQVSLCSVGVADGVIVIMIIC